MKKLLKNLTDIGGITLALGFLTWSYFFLTPGAWATIKASFDGFYLPGSGLSVWDWIVVVAVFLGIASTLVLWTKGQKILRGPVSVTLLR